MTSPALVWLRRDLRLHDHRSLASALKQHEKVLLLFVFDTSILADFPRKQDQRITFLVETLLHLHSQLRAYGGNLLIAHGVATEIVPKITQALKITHLYAAEDYEPGTQLRDQKIQELLEGKTQCFFQQEHVLQHPNHLLTQGHPYRVFTPYSRLWQKSLTQAQFQEYPVSLSCQQLSGWQEAVTLLAQQGIPLLSPEKGLNAMLSILKYEVSPNTYFPVKEAPIKLSEFTETKRLKDYAAHRNILAINGTSQLSPYLRFGHLSIRECYRAAAHKPGSDTWINELIWRDFYHMILFHYPETVRLEFQKHYRDVFPWNTNQDDFDRYCEGKTGFPIIDAAMRQLLEMGWMHNRARMIVASFLVKDLHIDWRLGEHYFSQYLMDYDLASNVGGWQWGASTGTDTQPYRIFNPWLQSQNFDPEGHYIKRYLPELRNVPSSALHDPAKLAKSKHLAPHYPSPMVDHQKARLLTLEMFRTAAKLSKA